MFKILNQTFKTGIVTTAYPAGAAEIPDSFRGRPHFDFANWRDAVEFMLLGSTSVQVCTAAMHYGFRIVEDMNRGLDNYLAEKGMKSAMELVGKSTKKVKDWGDLNLNYKVIAKIDAEKCIGCNLCYIACEDGAHQCITAAPRPFGDLRDGKKIGNGEEHDLAGITVAAC